MEHEVLTPEVEAEVGAWWRQAFEALEEPNPSAPQRAHCESVDSDGYERFVALGDPASQRPGRQ